MRVLFTDCRYKDFEVESAMWAFDGNRHGSTFIGIFKLSTRERSDWITPVCLVLLATIGIFFIYSAQLATGREQWQQQLLWLCIGAIVYVGTSLLDYRIWLRWSHWPSVSAARSK